MPGRRSLPVVRVSRSALPLHGPARQRFCALVQSPTTASIVRACFAPDLQADLLAGRQAADQVDQVVLVADGDAVHLQDHVVGCEPGGGGRRVGIDRFHQRPAGPVQPQLQGVGRLERWPPAACPGSRAATLPCSSSCRITRLTRLIGMLKATPLLLPLCEAMAVLMPMTSPSRLTSGPPLEPGIDGRVGLQEVLDADGAAQADLAALAGADDAVRHRLVQAERAADGQHPLADADAVAVAQRRRWARLSLPSSRSRATSDSGSAQTWPGRNSRPSARLIGDLFRGRRWR